MTITGMKLNPQTAAIVAAMVALPVAVGSRVLTAQARRRPVTVDDLMKLHAIVDVRVSPDGESVAYVVSTPSLSGNEHEGALFIVPARGGAPARRIGESVRIFNVPSPRTLKAMGKTVELEIYPRGGHVLREPMQQQEQMRNTLAWFQRWIKTD